MKERKNFYKKFITSIFMSILLINIIIPISYLQVNAAVRLEGYDKKAHNCLYDFKNTSQKDKMKVAHISAGIQSKKEVERDFLGYSDGVKISSKITTIIASKSSAKTTQSEEKQDASSLTLDDVNNAATGFIDAGRTDAEKNISTKSLQYLSSTIYNVLLILGIIIAIIIGLVLGIKFILGSIEQQAEVKKALVPYIAGCIIVFGAFTIWKITVNVLQSTQSSSQSSTQSTQQQNSTNHNGSSGRTHSSSGRSF